MQAQQVISYFNQLLELDDAETSILKEVFTEQRIKRR